MEQKCGPNTVTTNVAVDIVRPVAKESLVKVRAVFIGINNEAAIHEVKMCDGPIHDILRGADYVIVGLADGAGTIQYSKIPKKKKSDG